MMRAAFARPAANASSPAVMVGRFLLVGEEPGMWEWFLRCLYPAHGIRNRVRRAALLATATGARALLPSGGRALPDGSPARRAPAVEDPSSGGSDRLPHGSAERLLHAALERLDVPRLVGPSAGMPGRGGWVLAPGGRSRDPDRLRLVAFPFPPGAERPPFVLKVATGDGRLEREARLLAEVRSRLPGPLRDTVPEVLAFEGAGGMDTLALSTLPGRSPYVEMQGRLAPGRRVARHFRAAADWLGSFHRALRRPGAGPGSPTFVHGDFWPRNLLLDRSRTGVVDWEAASPEGDPFEDVFRFPATYGLAFPWERYRPLPAPEALRRVFLARGRVATAVRLYFRRYREIAGVPPPMLKEAFVTWVHGPAERVSRKEGGESDGAAAWAELGRRLAAGAPSVLDG